MEDGEIAPGGVVGDVSGLSGGTGRLTVGAQASGQIAYFFSGGVVCQGQLQWQESDKVTRVCVLA